MTQLLTIVLSVISVVGGYIITKSLEISREKRKFKTQLFLDYISISNKIENSKNPKDDMDYSATVEKLCLYANQDVLKKIAKFHKNYNDKKYDINFMDTDEGKELYSELIIAMRKDIGLRTKKIDTEKMINILELNKDQKPVSANNKK
jgi:hypothetical protein